MSADPNISGTRVRRSSNILRRVLREVRKHKILLILCLIGSLADDAIASSADPLGGPFYHFSVLRFVPAIASADPGPPTAGAVAFKHSEFQDIRQIREPILYRKLMAQGFGLRYGAN